jgi:hypothetical protein
LADDRIAAANPVNGLGPLAAPILIGMALLYHMGARPCYRSPIKALRRNEIPA